MHIITHITMHIIRYMKLLYLTLMNFGILSFAIHFLLNFLKFNLNPNSQYHESSSLNIKIDVIWTIQISGFA